MTALAASIDRTVAPAASGTAEPRPVATRFFVRPEGKIAYEDAGHGPLVVLIPGLGDVRAEYRRLAPTLRGAGYRVVSMDLRGHGESSVGWAEYSASAVGADVVGLLRELDAGPAYVVGTSLGAGAAAWAAAESPELVRSVVLIGPFVRDTPPAMPFQNLILRILFAPPWGVAAWSSYYASLYPSAPPADLPAYRAALCANLREPGRFAAVRGMIGASKADVAARLKDVRAPTLVLMGRQDPDFKNPDAEAEARHVADLLHGEVQMIDGAGHYPHVERPRESAAAIVRFLDAHGSARVSH